MAGKRRFELVAGTSRKFWEIAPSGNAFTTRYGRIGAAGQETTKRFSAAAAAAQAYERLVAAKVREGYREVTAPPPASPRGARPARLMKLSGTIAACTNAYGVVTEGDDWSNNLLSQKTVRGPSGKLGLAGEVDAAPDPKELKLCIRLAAAAGRIMGDLEIGMGSSGGETFDCFFVARHGQWKCLALEPWAIRPAFGGALFPAAKIKVLPLDERASWWKTVVRSFRANEDPDEEPGNSDTMRDGLRRWRKLMAWFKAEKAFAEAAFIAVDKPKGHSMRGGCVFPRLVLGRTRGGSIAGLFGAFVDA